MRLAKGHFQAFSEIISILRRHKGLVYEMAKHDIRGRFAGQAFGAVWIFFHPLFLISIYLFVFTVVFEQKVGGTIEMPRDFQTYLLAGLIPWMAIQESMARGVNAITAHANLVKQVVFPIEILPVKTILPCLLTQLVATSMLSAYSAINFGHLSWTYLLLPLTFLMQVMLMVGLAFILACVGAYFRDSKDIIQIFSVAGPFLIPAFYLPTQIPEIFRPLLYVNPFSHMVWVYQDIIYFGRIAHVWSWLIFFSTAFLVFVTGYRLFRKAKMMLGNFL